MIHCRASTHAPQAVKAKEAEVQRHQHDAATRKEELQGLQEQRAALVADRRRLFREESQLNQYVEGGGVFFSLCNVAVCAMLLWLCLFVCCCCCCTRLYQRTQHVH